MVNVTIYSSTMDPMGLDLSPGSGWPSRHETEVDLWGDESRSQKWLVRRVWLVWHGIDFGIVGYNMLHRLLYICYNESCSQMSLVLCISVPGFLLQWALLGSNRFLESQGHQVHLLVQWMFELANAPCSSFPSLNPVILSYPNPIHIWFRSIIIIIMIYISLIFIYIYNYISNCPSCSHPLPMLFAGWKPSPGSQEPLGVESGTCWRPRHAIGFPSAPRAGKRHQISSRFFLICFFWYVWYLAMSPDMFDDVGWIWLDLGYFGCCK
jgi:hypothetical protein